MPYKLWGPTLNVVLYTSLQVGPAEWTLVMSLAAAFLPLSLVTFGGVNVILPELYAISVTRYHWLSDADFYHLLALAFAAPGPNMLFVAMLGSRVAGVPGAIVATLAMVVPPSLLAIYVAGIWFRARGNRLRAVLHAALLPITTGIFAAATLAIGRAVIHGPIALTLAFCTLALILRSRIHPLWLLAAGGVVGIAAHL